MTAVPERRHGEERERSKCDEIGGGERVKPYEMPFTVSKALRWVLHSFRVSSNKKY